MNVVKFDFRANFWWETQEYCSAHIFRYVYNELRLWELDGLGKVVYYSIFGEDDESFFM